WISHAWAPCRRGTEMNKHASRAIKAGVRARTRARPTDASEGTAEPGSAERHDGLGAAGHRRIAIAREEEVGDADAEPDDHRAEADVGERAGGARGVEIVERRRGARAVWALGGSGVAVGDRGGAGDGADEEPGAGDAEGHVRDGAIFRVRRGARVDGDGGGVRRDG